MEFLAQIAPPVTAPDHSEALFFYLFAGVVSFLIVNVVGLVTIWALTRRTPSIDQQFATKAELHQLREEVAAFNLRNEQISQQIFSKLDGLGSSVNTSLQDMSRSVGKLEGHHEMAREIAEAIKGK